MQFLLINTVTWRQDSGFWSISFPLCPTTTYKRIVCTLPRGESNVLNWHFLMVNNFNFHSHIYASRSVCGFYWREQQLVTWKLEARKDLAAVFAPPVPKPPTFGSMKPWLSNIPCLTDVSDVRLILVSTIVESFTQTTGLTFYYIPIDSLLRMKRILLYI